MGHCFLLLLHCLLWASPKTIVPAGTPVQLQPENEADLSRNWRVVSEIRVDGVVVVTAGAEAEVRLLRTQTSPETGCTTLFFQAESVQAVDGRVLLLRPVEAAVVRCSEDSPRAVSLAGWVMRNTTVIVSPDAPPNTPPNKSGG